MKLYTDWQKWRDTLGDAVNLGKKMGMEDDTVVKVADRVGDFLMNRVDPANPEQKILQDLWSEADKEEQRVLAKLIVKMVDNKG